MTDAVSIVVCLLCRPRRSTEGQQSMLDELRNIKSGKKELREFGLTVGVILVILGCVALWRGKCVYPYFLSVGIALVGLGLAAPGVLLPLQKIWMALAVVISFFSSRLVLIILFYAVITPIGLAMRIFGKDVLDQKIDKTQQSYWKPRDAQQKTKESYENQF